MAQGQVLLEACTARSQDGDLRDLLILSAERVDWIEGRPITSSRNLGKLIGCFEKVLPPFQTGDNI